MKEKLHDKTNWLWKASPFIIALLFTLNVSAQAQTVNGNVSDVNSAGLPGVNVIVKGTSQGTITDQNGDYSLEVSSSDAVLFNVSNVRNSFWIKLRESLFISKLFFVLQNPTFFSAGFAA